MERNQEEIISLSVIIRLVINITCDAGTGTGSARVAAHVWLIAGRWLSGTRLIAANGLLARFCNGADAASPMTHTPLTLIGRVFA